jgi:predicted aldo/keto reductase-like oxidoreductase
MKKKPDRYRQHDKLIGEVSSMEKKRLGFGLMRLPLIDKADEGSVDIELSKKLVDAYLESGFNYFDTAWMYCGYQSEPAVKHILTERHPRDSYLLATKLHVNYVDRYEDCDSIFNAQCEKTGVSYFDRYLLHGLNEPRYVKYKEKGCIDWLFEKQAAGLVKEVGFSFHGDPETLEKILDENPGFQFVQIQLNYMDWENESVQSRRCYEILSERKIPIVVMEPVKGGLLVDIPKAFRERFREMHPSWSPASWAIRYVASLDNVETILSGMNSLDMIRDNLASVRSGEPFGEEEKKLVRECAAALSEEKAIQCTGCSYCTSGCPQNIPIPKYFALYNGYKIDQRYDAQGSQGAYYINLINTFGKASDCIGCGQCESICPQGIPIIEDLRKVAADFE